MRAYFLDFCNQTTKVVGKSGVRCPGQSYGAVKVELAHGGVGKTMFRPCSNLGLTGMRTELSANS